MTPLPTTNEGWLREIAAAYADARETIPVGPLVGTDVREQDLFHLGPVVRFKFRGIKRTKKSLQKATEAALASYVANQEREPEVLGSLHLAFAFCYIVAHLGLDLLAEDAAATVMDFVVEHERELVQELERVPGESPSLQVPTDPRQAPEQFALEPGSLTDPRRRDRIRVMPRAKKKAAKKKTSKKRPATRSAAGSRKVNKTAWVRDQPRDMPAKDVVKKAKAEGITLSIGQVYTARSSAKKVVGASPAGKALSRTASRNASTGTAGDELAFQRLVLSIGITRAEALLAGLKSTVGL